jgi:parallel beta-helix repeat protein
MEARNALRTLLAAAALSLAIAPGAQGAKPVHVSCGETIAKDTKLANDLIDCPGNGLVIGADDITLDLNGHTIDGDGDGFDSCATDCDAGVDNTGHARITVKHGTIREFVEGVAVEGASANRVEDLSTSGQAHGGVFVEQSTDVAVRGGRSVADGGGVFVVASSDVTVERNSVSGNEFAAIGVFASDHVLISRNTISDSGHSGIGILDGSRENRVEGNSISGGHTAGIAIEGGSGDNRVKGNSIADSDEAGIFLDGADHNTLTGNVSDGGEGGVDLEDSDDNLVARNSFRGNAFIGMFVNGARNTARGNRVSRSAFGISTGGDDNRIVGNVVTDGLGQPCDQELEGGCFAIAVEFGRGNSISDNSVERMPAGIELRTGDSEIPAVVDTTVQSNVIRGVGRDGLHVDSTAIGSLLDQNLAVGAADDGIDVDGPTTTLTRNTANGNHDLGIEAVPGVTDGGGNKARGNGNPLQCTNVFCK